MSNTAAKKMRRMARRIRAEGLPGKAASSEAFKKASRNQQKIIEGFDAMNAACETIRATPSEALGIGAAFSHLASVCGPVLDRINRPNWKASRKQNQAIVDGFARMSAAIQKIKVTPSEANTLASAFKKLALLCNDSLTSLNLPVTKSGKLGKLKVVPDPKPVPMKCATKGCGHLPNQHDFLSDGEKAICRKCACMKFTKAEEK